VDWFEDHFSVCDHGLVKGYCAACTVAAEEEAKRRERVERAEAENVKLRAALARHGIPYTEWGAGVVDVHLRMSPSQQAKLDMLAERASTTRSGLVRRLIDAAAAEADVRIPGERLTESELLDLLNEQARAGRSSAIIHLLQREDQRDWVDRLLEDIFDDRAE
jgi:hypothetical protein